MIRRNRFDPRQAFELLPQPGVLVDPEGNAVAANASARARFGMGTVLPPGGLPLDGLGPLAASLAALLGQGKTMPADLTDSASGCIFEVRVTRVNDVDGEWLLDVVLLDDVTRVREAAAHLESARARLRERVREQADALHGLAAQLENERSHIASQQHELLAIEEAAGIGHWTWRAETSELEVSEGAVRLLGAPAGQRLMPGSPPRVENVAEPDRDAVLRQFERIAKGDPVGELRFSVVAAGPRGPLRVLATPPVYGHEDGRLRYAIGLLQDVTAQEFTARNLEELNRALESGVEARTRDLAEVARSLEGFAYMATHELRAPLRAINGGATIALEEFGEFVDAVSLAELREIVGLANQLDGLIDQLRALATRAGSGSVRAEVDLAPLTRRSAREFAGRGVVLSCPESLPVRADPGCAPVMWRQLLARICETCASAAESVRITAHATPQGVALQAPAFAIPPQLDPLLAELLRRSGLELQRNPGDVQGSLRVLLQPLPGESPA